MGNADVAVSFSPPTLKAFARNEAKMDLLVANGSTTNTFWCECELRITSPLSLAPDSELNSGRMRIGIIKPLGRNTKSVRLYTRPNNYPDDYKFSITAYFYDEDGTISERVDKDVSIACIASEAAQTDASVPQQV